jgi:hypothetical protein
MNQVSQSPSGTEAEHEKVRWQPKECVQLFNVSLSQFSKELLKKNLTEPPFLSQWGWIF